MIEKENGMTADYVLKQIPAIRLAAVTATLDPSEFTGCIGPMFDQVASALDKVHASLATPVATYAEAEAGMDVVVGFAYSGEALPDVEVVDLPASAAVCGVHLGSMSTIGESWQALHRWLVESGHQHAGACREAYVRSGSEDQQDWVTELQQPVS